MPNDNNVRTLLKARLTRAAGDWNTRLEVRMRERDPGGTCALALVRIWPADYAQYPGYEQRWRPAPEQFPLIGNALKVTVIRHLGEDEFIVVLHQDRDRNELALCGHLDVARAAFRMIAI